MSLFIFLMLFIIIKFIRLYFRSIFMEYEFSYKDKGFLDKLINSLGDVSNQVSLLYLMIYRFRLIS